MEVSVRKNQKKSKKHQLTSKTQIGISQLKPADTAGIFGFMMPMSSSSNDNSPFHNNRMEGEVVRSRLTRWGCNLQIKK
jgi:hypothetical protein